jgi:hypothetical protein
MKWSRPSLPHNVLMHGLCCARISEAAEVKNNMVVRGVAADEVT